MPAERSQGKEVSAVFVFRRLVAALVLGVLVIACGASTSEQAQGGGDFVFKADIWPAFTPPLALTVDRTGSEATLRITSRGKNRSDPQETGIHDVASEAASRFLATMRRIAALAASEPIDGRDGVTVDVALTIEGQATIPAGTRFWCLEHKRQPREYWMLVAICDLVDTVDLGERQAEHYAVVRNRWFEIDHWRAEWERFRAEKGL
jgi:hypothetical protein